jgi:hypothetical protein
MKWLFVLMLALSAIPVKAQVTRSAIAIHPAIAKHGEDVVIAAEFYIVSHGDKHTLTHTISNSPAHPGDSLCLLNLVRVPTGMTLPFASYDVFQDTLRNLPVGRYRLAFDSASSLTFPLQDSVYFQVVDAHVLPLLREGRKRGSIPSQRLGAWNRWPSISGRSGGKLWQDGNGDLVGRHRPWLKP